MRVAVAFDHAVRRAALAACLSSDDTSITALAERSQRWPRGREQMRRRGEATRSDSRRHGRIVTTNQSSEFSVGTYLPIRDQESD
jgi:hypothetical protein